MEGGGDDKEPHCCRACGKRFPCARSLCSHMRSHSSSISPSFSSSSSDDDDGDYEFAKKMTMRDCTNGGSTVTTTTTTSSGSRTFMELRACLQAPERAVPRRAATRRRSRRVASISAASELDEDEDVALCLMMLSRDSLMSKRKGEEDLPAKPKKITGGGESEKRARFACPECNKPFRSYQALGGHRANRKRINGGACCTSSSSKIPDDSFVASPESAKKAARAHRCPICDKVFGSGQALGGHKRSHLMANSTDRNCESRDLLDLNLPAPVDDSSNAKENVECKSWWIEGDHNKHGSLVGFI